MVNFLAVLCDGSTDKSVAEQEYVFVAFADPETGKPALAFFEVVTLSESQDAPGLKKAIINTFKRNSLEFVTEKIVFLSSDGAWVNCGKHSRLIKLFQENCPWVSFVWCFSHKRDLALKDAVKEVLEPVDTSQCDLYYLYGKFSKKQRELKNLFNVLEGQFETYTAGVCTVKATGTCWLDHNIRAVGRVVEKLGLYNQHLENVISTTANVELRATLDGKYAKLLDAKILLCCALFIDVLAEAKNFSLKTQKIDVSIIGVVEAVENTKQNY